MTTNTKIAIAIYITTLGILLYYNLTHPPVNDGVKEYETFLLNFDHGWEYRRTLVNSSLITTWLPAMVARYTGLDAMTLFRITPPIFYALMPAFTYLIARRYLAVRYALVASLVVIANSYILFFPDIGRVGVGIAFFAGMIWALLEKKSWWAITFALLVVFAHYGTALIALGVSLVYVVGYWIQERQLPKRYLLMVCLMIVLIYVWHFWISSYSGWVMLTYGTQTELPVLTGDTYSFTVGPQIDAFTDISAREKAVQQALGQMEMTIPEKINVIVNWIVVVAITLGLVVILRMKQIEVVFKVLGASLWLLIAFTVAVPWLSYFYGGMRVYFTTLPVLAVGLPVGVKWIAEKIRIGKIQIKPLVLCGIVLVVLAMSTSGLVHRAFGEVKTTAVYWSMDDLEVKS